MLYVIVTSNISPFGCSGAACAQAKTSTKNCGPETTMARKSDKHEKQLIDIVNNRNNGNKCGECNSDYPTWASWNLGILLCGRCANIHKKVLSVNGPQGGPISKVKSLTLEQWSDEQIDALRRGGNKRAKSRWNPKRAPFPHDDDDDTPVEEYLRDKYVYGRFRDDRIENDDYEGRFSEDSEIPGKGSRSRLSTVNSMTASRLRANSRLVPRLSHRKLTNFEQTQYQSQLRKLMAFGYSDRECALESLILSGGDIEFALDILDYDAKINPTLAEIPPDLPKRPAATSASATFSAPVSAPGSAPASASTPVLSDWWGAQAPQPQVPQVQVQSAQLGQPQIYQYTDPITGQVSYVDANGQQYLDPNNPQHQTLLYQQTNPQLVAQQTNKQSILALYNQPAGQPQTQQPEATGFQPQATGYQQQTSGFQLQQATGFQPQQATGFQVQQATGFQGFGQNSQPQQQFGQPHQTGFFVALQQQFQYGQPQQQYFR